MDDPIAMLVEVAGETLTLIINTPPGPYSPDADYNPGADGSTDYPGVVARGGVTELPAGCSAAFTILTPVVPAGLEAMVTQARLNGRKYAVHSWRERHHNGAVNGVTLYLKA